MIRDYDPGRDREEVVDMLNELNMLQAKIDPMKIKKIDDSVGEKAFLQIEEKKKVGDVYIRILEINTEVAGMAVGFIPRYTNKIGRLLKLFIKKEFRGGNGVLMTNDMEDIFVKNNCEGIRVQVFVPNENAVRFYSSNEFTDRYKIMFKKLI